MEPGASSGSFAGGVRDIQTPALPSTAPFEAYIHEGKKEAQEEWVASTIFVASDHIVHVLAKNMYTRNQADGDARHRFILSAWDFHGKIMHNYVKWCDHVGLPQRPVSQNDWFSKAEPFADDACNLILSEVALMFLVWTEGHNLRYMPELINFLYWCMRFSSIFEEAANVSSGGRGDVQPVPSDPEMIVPNLRQYREEFRRNYWVQIMKLRDRWKDEGVEPTPKLISQYTGVDDHNAPILGEVIRNGDGGDHLDLIVQPIFNFLAIELDEKGGKQGIETINRINYDDVNESLTNKTLVHRTLRKLGETSGSKTKNVNEAYKAITELPFDDQGVFDTDLATSFWRRYTFTKTFRERRSYLQIFRMFWRMIAFHALIFHELLVIALYGVSDFKIESCPDEIRDIINSSDESDETPAEEIDESECENVSGFIAAHSSLLLTHCFLFMLERLSAGYLSLGVKDPSKKVVKRRKMLKQGFIDLEAIQEEGEELTKSKEKKKKEKVPKLRIEGTPFGVFLEGFLWLFIFVVMTAVFVLQFIKPDSVGVSGFEKADFKKYWIFVSVAYFVLSVAHAICSTRDGYQVSITSYFSMGFLSRFSIRGRPQNEVNPITVLKISWRVFAWNVAFWTITLSVKCLFDYFLIILPLADGLKALTDEGWLGSVFPDDTKIPSTDIKLPEDADFVLIFARSIPSFLITFIDTSVFYMIMSVFFGMARGLVLLNLGVVGNFSEVQTEFRRAPKQWWQKCISPEGQRNIRENLLKHRSLLPEDQIEPEEETTKKTKRSKKKKNEKKSKKDPNEMIPDDEAKHDVFSTTWNEIIDDLRAADLVSNTERDLLKYTRLAWHESMFQSKLKPLIPPTFIFAGQLQKLVESPKPSRSQLFLLQELRNWLLFLLVQLDMIDKDFAESLKYVFLLEEPFDRHHRISRRNLLTAVTDFLKALSHLSKQSPRETDKWEIEVDNVRKAMEKVFEELYYELNALGDHKKTKRLKLRAGPLKQNIELLERFITHMKRTFLGKDKKGVLERTLAVLSRDETASNFEYSDQEEGEARGGGSRAPQDLLLKLIHGLTKRVTTPRIVATPSGREARQFLTFFVTSLFNPQLSQPPSLVHMMSWTTMVPVYQEDVIYALEYNETARTVGLDPKGNIGSITDLMTETDTRVSLLSYLRAVYPKDWINLLERMKDKFGLEFEAPDEINGTEFFEGGRYASVQTELLLWASYRGQLLARTVRGMMVYEKALKLIALLEHPRTDDLDDDDYNIAVEECVAAKFRCVVAAQVYGTNRKGRNLKQRWDAKAVELLLNRNPTLRVSYIDSEKLDDRKVQYAVLIRGGQMGETDVEEVYRIRMPVNEVTDRGIVIGEGKPENQNHAICFAFGENLQTIDMNQDNFLLEAMKMRSLLQELKTPEYNPKSVPKNCRDYSTKIIKRLDRKYLKKPILIGFREWIFSDKAGALGSFAAGTEFAFGTILQRVMTFPGRARFHYGHPDVWDKLFILTRGGISKATRNLHVSEDVFGGFNAALRGGKIAYRDYISVGKGRDMGFVSINGFEIKISGGNGEVCISRDLYRVATRVDFFRMMSVYYSGPGFFINNAILMTTVYLQTWVLAVLALAGAYLVASGSFQESEGIGLTDPPPSPDDDQSTAIAGRRLLMDHPERHLEQVYGGGGNSNDAPSDTEGTTTGDGPNGATTSQQQAAYYADFYNTNVPDTSSSTADTGGSATTDTSSNDYFSSYNDSPTTGGAPTGGAPVARGAPSTVAQNPFVESDKEIRDLIAKYNDTAAGLKDVQTSVGITSIVQLGMLTVIAYVGELLLELGLLQTLVIILIQVISGSLAFFIFKQQTDASAFLEDMNYGGARYVGTGREFALMHNPFVTLYVRYARSHFYFAYNLVLLCIMLLILDIPGYASATFGAWMVALSLLSAPFWFNPVQFVVHQTKTDYKQFNRWLQGEEVDPDSKHTWYTWHDNKMAKIRNEKSNITDHYLNGARSILWSLFTNCLLSIAAISQIRTDDDLDYLDDLQTEIDTIENAMARAQLSNVDDMDKLIRQKDRIQQALLREEDDELGLSRRNAPDKFRKYLFVTVAMLAVGALLYLVFTSMRAAGKARGARIIRVATAIAFIVASCVIAMYPDFLETRDHNNGWRNLMLIYYANLNFVFFIVQFLEHTFFDRVSVRHLVDKAYFMLDNVCSTILFAIIFILSFIRIVSIIQNTLLYNVSVASSIQSKELVETIGMEKLKQYKDDSEDGDNGDRTNQVSEALERLTDPNRSREGDMGASTREGSFTRGDSMTKKGMYRSRESTISDRYATGRTHSYEDHGAPSTSTKYQYSRH
eukprot:g4797.t1